MRLSAPKIRPNRAISLPEKPLALATSTRANDDQLPAGGAWGRQVLIDTQRTQASGGRLSVPRPCGEIIRGKLQHEPKIEAFDRRQCIKAEAEKGKLAHP